MPRRRQVALIMLGFGIGILAGRISGNQPSALGQVDLAMVDKFADLQWSSLKGYRPIINVQGSVVLMAAPPKTNPLPSGQLTDLPAKIIGFLYLSKESSRYKLGAGRYAVQVVSVSGDTAEVRFLDGQSKPVGEAHASIRKAPKVDTPIASVDSSVCYRFDETVTCI